MHTPLIATFEDNLPAFIGTLLTIALSGAAWFNRMRAASAEQARQQAPAAVPWDDLDAWVDELFCTHLEREPGSLLDRNFLSAILTPVEILDVIETIEDRTGVSLPSDLHRSAETYGELRRSIVDGLAAARTQSI